MIKIDNVCSKEILELCNRYKADIVTIPYAFKKRVFSPKLGRDLYRVLLAPIVMGLWKNL